MNQENNKGSRENNRFIGKTLKPRIPEQDILRKGGAHVEAKSKLRNDAKRHIQAALEEEY